MDNLLLTENDRVLILGASGFVGRRLAKALAEQNIKLRLLSRHSNGLADLNINTSDVQVVTGDLVQNVGLN
ncbi:MAG: NAD(P)H-binding protein, partial [Deltaproteobacteria bacterium]|nr:NAD(P)H-binding protein [Deltaproteobacteria bacterium]